MSVLGLAIGDALGMPFETHHFTGKNLMNWDGRFRDSVSPINANLKAGQWTDDTKMARALAQSLLQCDEFDPHKVSQSYLDWYKSKDLRGIGDTTNHALRRILRGYPDPGIKGSKGNGSAMRAAPIGMFFRDPNKIIAVASQDSALTHDSMEAKIGASIVALGVFYARLGIRKKDIPAYVLDSLDQHLVSRAFQMHNEHLYKVVKGVRTASLKARSEPSLSTLIDMGTGACVMESVPAAFYCFLATETFKDAVHMAVHGGGDTDTNAAITGALAGAYYGPDAMREFDTVEDYLELVELDQNLLRGQSEFPPSWRT